MPVTTENQLLLGYLLLVVSWNYIQQFSLRVVQNSSILGGSWSREIESLSCWFIHMLALVSLVGSRLDHCTLSDYNSDWRNFPSMCWRSSSTGWKQNPTNGERTLPCQLPIGRDKTDDTTTIIASFFTCLSLHSETFSLGKTEIIEILRKNAINLR